MTIELSVSAAVPEQRKDEPSQELLELLAATTSGESSVTEVIRPSAILPETETRLILAELQVRDVRVGGCWFAEPGLWRRYARPSTNGRLPGDDELVGTIQAAYGMPTRFEITLYRATVTSVGMALGWTVTALCNEALSFGGLTLDTCPRADLSPPPKPFRLR